MTRKLLALALVLLALPASAAVDPVEYYATVDRDEAALDETVTLSVTLAMNEGKEPKTLELPKAPDFEVASTSRADQMSFAFGGGTPSFRKVRVYTLVLRPKREGELSILPGWVVVDGKRYETAKLTVRVTPAGSGGRVRPAPPPGAGPPGFPPGFGPPPGFFDDDEDPFGSILGGGPKPGDADIFLRSTVDRRKAYVGEQVTLSVYLMSRLEISGIEAFKMPRLDGFWAEDIESPTQITGELKYVDGVPYRAYLLKRRALFPLKAGSLEIEPVEVDVVTGFSFLASGRKVHRKSVADTIEVKPLPPGAPAGFLPGNVGQWELSISAEPLEVPVGSPVTVRIAANGRGNLQNLEPPALPKLPGFKVFDPVREEKVAIRGGRYGGRKTLEYVLVPEQAGAYVIPGQRLVYFDPKQEQYLVSETEPIELRIEPGAGVAARTGPAAAAEDGNAGLRPIVASPELEGPGAPPWRASWFWVALAIPAVVLVGGSVAPLVARARAKGEGRRQVRQAGKVAKKRLASSSSLAVARDKAFFAELDRALHEYLAVKLGRPTVGLTRDDLARVLGEAGAPAAAIASIREVLEACDVGRFAPGAVDGASVDRALEEAAGAIDALEAAGFGRKA